MDTFLNAVRIINVILSFTCIVIWMMFYKGKKAIGAIAPITWLFHFLIFSGYIIIGSNTKEYTMIMDIWSSLLFLHTIILSLVTASMSGSPILLIKKLKKGGEKNDIRDP